MNYFHRLLTFIGPKMVTFKNWTTHLWRPELNSETSPSLNDYQNQPSFYGLKDISQPSSNMSFKLSAGIFDSIKRLGSADTLQIPLPIINSNLSQNVLPVLKNGKMHFYFYDPVNSIDNWTELINPLNTGISTIDFEPVLSDINSNGISELIIPQVNELYSIEFNEDLPVAELLTTSNESFTCSPIFAFGKLYAATENSILSVDEIRKRSLNRINFPGGAYRLAATDSNLVIMQRNKLILLEPQTYSIVKTYNLPDIFTQYEPVIVKDTLSDGFIYIVMSDNGNIYKCYQNTVTVIFHNNDQDVLPTNLAVSSWGNYSPCIIFGLKDRLFALKMDGTLLPGYPVYLENYRAKPYSHLRIRFNPSISFNINTEVAYLQLNEGGYLAINANGVINKFSSMIDIKPDCYNQTYYVPTEDKLFWFFNNNDSSLYAAELTEQNQLPFVWLGFRNGYSGQVALGFYEPNTISTKLNAYAFPNPVKNNRVTIRIENPKNRVSINIYDITGKKLYQKTDTTESVEYKDFQFDVSNFSSGVYLVTAESNNQIKRFKFAIEK